MVRFFKSIFEKFLNIKIVYSQNYREAVLLSFDKKIKDILTRNIKKEKVILFDVGGHKGESIKRYRDIFKASVIHCFEPNEALMKGLKEKFKIENLFLNQCGISDEIGEIQLNIASKTLMSSIEKINYESNFFKSRKIIDNGSEIIMLDTLDNYAKNNNIEYIDVLKLNVQGHEPNCLKGAKKLLKENKIDFIIVEIDGSDRYSKKNSFFDIEQYLVPYNYYLYDLILIKRNNFGKINMLNAVYRSNKNIILDS
jgi:FkbM family methyltransferase